jgi:hypothetical protein
MDTMSRLTVLSVPRSNALKNGSVLFDALGRVQIG